MNGKIIPRLELIIMLIAALIIPVSYTIVNSQQSTSTVQVDQVSLPGLLAVSEQPFNIVQNSEFSNSHLLAITDTSNRIHLITSQFSPADGESWIVHLWNETNTEFSLRRIAIISSQDGILLPFRWKTGIGLIYRAVDSDDYQFYQWQNETQFDIVNISSKEKQGFYKSFKVFPGSNEVDIVTRESIGERGSNIYIYNIDSNNIITSSIRTVALDNYLSDFVLDGNTLYFSGKEYVDDENGELERVIYSTFILNETDDANELFSFETSTLVRDDNGNRIFSIFNNKIIYVGNYQSEIYDLTSSELTAWSYNDLEETDSIFVYSKFAQIGSSFYFQSYDHPQFERIWKIDPIAENIEFVKNEMWHGSDMSGSGFAVINENVISGFTRLLTESEIMSLKIVNPELDMWGLWLSDKQIQLPIYFSPRIQFETQTTTLNDLSYPLNILGVGILVIFVRKKRIN